MPLGITMTWISFIVGGLMIFVMAIAGGKDVWQMFQDSKKAGKKKEAAESAE